MAGRPPKNNDQSKKHRLEIRMNDSEFEMLKKVTKMHKQTASEYFRSIVKSDYEEHYIDVF